MQNSFINPMLEREFAEMLEEHLRCCIPSLSNLPLWVLLTSA